MKNVFSELSRIQHTNPLEKKDMIAALRGYDEEYNEFTAKHISRMAGVEYKPTKRNYRTQKEHIQVMNFVRDNITHKDKDWRKGNGRPKGSGTKESLVKEYIKQNPDDNPTEISRALEISRTTVYKYL